MTRSRYLAAFMFCSICLAPLACSSHAKEHSQSSLAISVSAPNDIGDTLTTVYTQAIIAFITVAQQKEGVRFDTLFFGKHVYGQPDDFPNISLPKTIEQTSIELIAPELGLKKQLERKSLVYVNLMGWVDQETASFIFVVFSNGAEHQYDYFIDFNYNRSHQAFELEKIAYENHVDHKGEKPKHEVIYHKDK